MKPRKPIIKSPLDSLFEKENKGGIKDEGKENRGDRRFIYSDVYTQYYGYNTKMEGYTQCGYNAKLE